MQLIILSGLSGAGKSIALHTLEDVGFYCIDNLPFFLLQDLLSRLTHQPDTALRKTAVGIDARGTPEALHRLPELIQTAQAHGIDCRLLFLDAQLDTLIRRYSETRRRHPLTQGDRSLREAILLEQELLEPVRAHADLRIDTSQTNVHELRDRVRGWILGDASPRLSILLKSFGFKHGVPPDVDFVFDVRCLPNPHWQPELRPRTGLDPEVAQFLESNPEVIRMRDEILGFFERWMPQLEGDGRSYLTIAIGCTGGQHRSVYMIERLRERFTALGHRVIVRHRELA
ncbi:RNase adapter RapZ [Caldichromatium japonicum]|uniref:RNase adapter RapZ n=1 Tax=Caldichromatium japonicum TaxID=2699430 RepID=A0A6G7VA49_9GAMM|nr:RNase adapter RapZ [Caldichromatium japonicum]QIK36939.1 RNase adapter RapZ [Caldichromatium japonicum]